MNPVLWSTEWLIRDPEHVAIDKGAIEKVAMRFSREPLEIPRWDLPVYPEHNDKDTIDFFLVGNAINFCYFDDSGERTYKVDYAGKEWGTAMGMWASLKKALDAGIPITDGEYLSRIDMETGRKIFGNIPMLKERVHILQNVGGVLCSLYDARFHNMIDSQSLFDEDGLVRSLILDFWDFDDHYDIGDMMPMFHKRAQLAFGMLYGRFRNQDGLVFDDVDQLTVFADYVLPKGLRDLGVLKYSDTLAQAIDKGYWIAEGSGVELEIRASTLHAADMIIKRMQELGRDVNALHLDAKLWLESRGGGSPYHMTRTTRY